MIAREIMEAEIARQIGAGKGEITEARSTHRNGYRPRPWSTRVGEIELAVPLAERSAALARLDRLTRLSPRAEGVQQAARASA